MRWTWKEFAVLAGAGLIAYTLLKKSASETPTPKSGVSEFANDWVDTFTKNLDAALNRTKNEFGEGYASDFSTSPPKATPEAGVYPTPFVQDVASQVAWQLAATGQGENVVVRSPSPDVAVVKPATQTPNYTEAMHTAEIIALNVVNASRQAGQSEIYGTTTAGGIILTPAPVSGGANVGASQTLDVASRLARGLM